MTPTPRTPPPAPPPPPIGEQQQQQQQQQQQNGADPTTVVSARRTTRTSLDGRCDYDYDDPNNSSSCCSEDLDDPYHETACDWWFRRRRLHGQRKRSGDRYDVNDGAGGGEEVDEWLIRRYPNLAAESFFYVASSTATGPKKRSAEGKVMRKLLVDSARRRKRQQSSGGGGGKRRRVTTEEGGEAGLDEEAAAAAPTGKEDEEEASRMIAASTLPRNPVPFLRVPMPSRRRNRRSSSSFATNGSSRRGGGNGGRAEVDDDGPVLELTGETAVGKTAILVTLAASYVVATSRGFLFERDDDLLLDDEANNDGAADDSSGGGWTPHFGAPFDGRGVVGAPPSETAEAPTAKSLEATGRRSDDEGRATAMMKEPSVVLLDVEHGIHFSHLASAVRAAALRRWGDASVARSYLRQMRWKRKKNRLKRCDGDGNGGDADNSHEEDCYEENGDDSGERCNGEWRRIEQLVVEALGRIHIIRPADFARTGCVLESLRQSLDHSYEPKENGGAVAASVDGGTRSATARKRKSNRLASAPTLLLLDSLTAFDQIDRFHESLPPAAGRSSSGRRRSGVGTGRTTKSGLGGRDEFYRQLARLRARHDLVVAGTRCTLAPVASSKHSMGVGDGGTASAAVASSSNPSATGSGSVKGSDGWSRTVSHRVELQRAARGTREDEDGYRFVALVPESGGALSSGVCDRRLGLTVVPYSVKPGGILC